MRKYEALYEELDEMDAQLSKDIKSLKDDIEGRKRLQLILEQELAGMLLLQTEIRQFLKESGITET